MTMKFDRAQIASINSIHSTINKRKRVENSVKIAVPEKETFKHILENAKKGNEMAAVLLDEWQKSCKPKDAKEKQVVNMINKAIEKMFE